VRSQAADFFEKGIQNLFPDMASASVLAVTTLRSSFKSVCIFLYIIIFFLIVCFVNTSPEVTF
jgi:hypothetical protein